MHVHCIQQSKMFHQKQVFLNGNDTRQFPIDAVKTSRRPGKIRQTLVEGVVRQNRQYVQGVERVLTSTLEYVLQKMHFAKYVERRAG